MTKQLSITVSDELYDWVHEEAKELDVAISPFVESMLRAAFKKIGAGEAVRLGMESMAYTPRRSIRRALPWEVVKTVPHRSRMIADEYRLGQFRLQHKGQRGSGGKGMEPGERREPHGRDDQALDGWYLTGPGLVSPFIWLGTEISEAKREASVWGARRPERKGRR